MRACTQLLLCSVGFVGFTAPAFAQEQPAPESQPDQASTSQATTVIIVQARRRDEDVQDVPAVIDTVSSEEIGKLAMRDFKEVSTLAPGLDLSTNANGIGGNARLRGVNFDVNASGNNPTVEFYMNDAPITAGVVLQQMYDIGQIEVLRGPQGTLRGRASPSGSITVSTRKPDLYSFGGFGDLLASDIGTTNAKAAVNVPIIEGIAAIRAAGVWDENELDRVKPLNGGPNPHGKTVSGRISGLVTPTDWLRFEGVYQRMDVDLRNYPQAASFSEVNPNAPASNPYISSKDRLSIQEDPTDVSQTFDIYNWRAEARGWGQVLIYQGQHYTQDILSMEATDKANLFPGDDYAFHTHAKAKSTSHEVRIQNEERLFDMLDYVVGYFDNKNFAGTDLTQPTILRLPLAFGGGVASVVNTPIRSTTDSHEKSIFGNLTVHIGEATEVSGGLRHIDFNNLSELYINGNLVRPTPSDASEWVYSASIKHEFTPDFMIYASTGSSWRPEINVVGDFNIAPSALENSFLYLPAETSKSYEIGLKSNLMDNRLRFNLTGYYQKFKNYPYRIPNNGVYYITTSMTANGPVQQVDDFNFVGAVPVEVWGIEGDVAFDIMQGWNLSATASYSLGKIQNGTIPCTDLNNDGTPDAVTSAPSLADMQAAVGADNISACQVSQRSSFMPPFSATVQSEYDFAVSGEVDGYLRGLLTYNGKSQGDPANAFDDVSDYALVNLFAGIRAPDGAWEVGLYAKNVFDTTKTLTRSNPLSTSYQQLRVTGVDPSTGRPTLGSAGGVTYSSPYTGVTVTAPREFGLNVKFAFGSR